VLKSSQVRGAKRSDEIPDEFLLWLLRQRDSKQLKLCLGRALANGVGETEIARETNVIACERKLIKLPIVQALHSESLNRFDLVTFRAQGGDKLPGQILIKQNLHACCGSC